MEPSRASTLGCFGRKMPQSTQREPSSSDSRGGRSQTWPSAANCRADVWWCGHWSSKLWRRVANDMLDGWFILMFWASRFSVLAYTLECILQMLRDDSDALYMSLPCSSALEPDASSGSRPRYSLGVLPRSIHIKLDELCVFTRLYTLCAMSLPWCSNVRSKSMNKCMCSKRVEVVNPTRAQAGIPMSTRCKFNEPLSSTSNTKYRAPEITKDIILIAGCILCITSFILPP